MRILVIFALLALASCDLKMGHYDEDGNKIIYSDSTSGNLHDCSSAITDLIKSKGSPEEIKKYDTSDNYHSHDYWYWSKGFSKTFKWGNLFDGCETSTYTFTPI